MGWWFNVWLSLTVWCHVLFTQSQKEHISSPNLYRGEKVLGFVTLKSVICPRLCILISRPGSCLIMNHSKMLICRAPVAKSSNIQWPLWEDQPDSDTEIFTPFLITTLLSAIRPTLTPLGSLSNIVSGSHRSITMCKRLRGKNVGEMLPNPNTSHIQIIIVFLCLNLFFFLLFSATYTQCC